MAELTPLELSPGAVERGVQTSASIVVEIVSLFRQVRVWIHIDRRRPFHPAGSEVLRRSLGHLAQLPFALPYYSW